MGSIYLALRYILKLRFIIDNFNVAMEVVDHNLSINCPSVLNMTVISAGTSLSGQVGPESSEVLFYVYTFQQFIFLSFSFDVFLARKTRSLMLRVENFTRIGRGFPSAALPTRWDTAISSGWTGGSTLIAAHRVMTAASVSSDSSTSGIPDILKLSRRPCCSSWHSLSFCSAIVLFNSWFLDLWPAVHPWLVLIDNERDDISNHRRPDY